MTSPLENLLQLEIRLRPKLQAIPYWTAAVGIGLTAYFYSTLFVAAGHLAQVLSVDRPVFWVGFAPLALMASVWIVDRWAPGAGGTGVPRVIEALNHDSLVDQPDVEKNLSLRTGAVVVLSSLLAAMAGGSLGNEGPMIHISAVVFYFVGKRFHRIWPYEEHRSWIVAGGAAGLAAAFNTPLAGVVFVVEELAQQHFNRFKTYVISAVVIAGVVSQLMSGRYLYLGSPTISDSSLRPLGWTVVLGVLCGLTAGFFKFLVRSLEPVRRHPHRYSRLGFAALVGLGLAAAAIYTRGISPGSGVHTIERLLFEEGYLGRWQNFFIRFGNVLLTHLTGCAGGFLAPSLTLGGTLGSLFSAATGLADHALFVLAGMAGMLSAMTRAPFTAWVIVMEMTDKHSAIFALMIAALTSHLVSGLFERKPAISS